MKKWLWIFTIVIVIFLMLCAFTFFFVIPKAAEASLPFKWKHVPTGLKRDEYQIYLGKPSIENSKDVWIVRNGNYTFSLAASYSVDTVVEKIQIEYTFSNYIFNKHGIIQKYDE